MLKLTRNIGLTILALLISLLAYTVIFEYTTFNNTTIEMSSLVRRGNRYCTQQAQDIDIVKKQIETNYQSRQAYKVWLEDMQNYSGFKNLRVSGGVLSTTVPSEFEADTTVTSDVIPFLMDDFYKGSSGNGYTPLNFGMTYLDPVKLQEDMEYYLTVNIRDFNNYLSAGKNGLYRIDPYTLEVAVELNMKPVRIDKTGNRATQEEYAKIFGLDLNSELGKKLASKEGLKTIVKYEILYKIKWDYIPTSAFFILTQDKAERIPQEYVYRQISYDKNVEKRLDTAVLKGVFTAPLEYKYDYVLTN